MANRKEDLQTGDRVKLSGGYSFEPAWLSGQDCVEGAVAAFIPGENDSPAAVIKLDAPISARGVTGDTLVLELRYVGATWGPRGVVHVELCDFSPEPRPSKERRHGKWVESHATYEFQTK